MNDLPVVVLTTKGRGNPKVEGLNIRAITDPGSPMLEVKKTHEFGGRVLGDPFGADELAFAKSRRGELQRLGHLLPTTDGGTERIRERRVVSM
jgi:hypothetical protein